MMARMELVLVVMAAAALACATEHLGDGVGLSYQEAIAKQAVRPMNQSAQPVTGLDSQEAAIISESYRRSLAPKGVNVAEEPVLYVGPQPTGLGTRGLMPPPSVPKESR